MKDSERPQNQPTEGTESLRPRSSPLRQDFGSWWLTNLICLTCFVGAALSEVINSDRTGDFYVGDKVDISLEPYFKLNNMTFDYFSLQTTGGAASIPSLLPNPRSVAFGFEVCDLVQRKSALSFLVACKSGAGQNMQSAVLWMSYQPLADSNQLTTTSVVMLPPGAEITTFVFEPSCGKIFILAGYAGNNTRVLLAYNVLNPISASATLDVSADIGTFESPTLTVSRNGTVAGMQAFVALVDTKPAVVAAPVAIQTYNFTGTVLKSSGSVSVSSPAGSVVSCFFSDFAAHVLVQTANTSLGLQTCRVLFNSSGAVSLSCDTQHMFVSAATLQTGLWMLQVDSFQEESGQQNITFVSQSGQVAVWTISTGYSPFSISTTAASIPISLSETILNQGTKENSIWAKISKLSSFSISANKALTITFEEADTGILRAWTLVVSKNRTINTVITTQLTSKQGALAYIQPSPYYWDKDLVVVLGASQMLSGHRKNGIVVSIDFSKSTGSRLDLLVTYNAPNTASTSQNFSFNVVPDLALVSFSTPQETFLVSENEPFNIEGAVTTMKTIKGNYQANLANIQFQNKCIGCDILYANSTTVNFDSMGPAENIILLKNLNNNSFLVRYQNSTHALYTCTPRPVGSSNWNPRTPPPSLDCTLRLSPLSVNCNLLVAGFVKSYGPSAKDPIELYLLTATSLFTNLLLFTESDGTISVQSKTYPLLLSMGDFDFNVSANAVNVLAYGTYQGSVENLQFLTLIPYAGGYGTAVLPVAFQEGISLPPAFTVDTLMWANAGHITVSGFTRALTSSQSQVRRYRVMRFQVASDRNLGTYTTGFESEAVVEESLLNDQTQFKCIIDSTLWVVDPSSGYLTALTLDKSSSVAVKKFEFAQINVDVSKTTNIACHDESDTIVLTINNGKTALVLKADPLISPLDRAHSVIPISTNQAYQAEAIGIFYQPDFFAYSPQAIYTLFLLPNSFSSTLHLMAAPLISATCPWSATEGFTLQTLKSTKTQTVSIVSQNYTPSGDWIVNTQINANEVSANKNLTIEDVVSIEASIGNLSICDSDGLPVPANIASVSQYMIPNNNPPWKFVLSSADPRMLVRQLCDYIGVYSQGIVSLYVKSQSDPLFSASVPNLKDFSMFNYYSTVGIAYLTTGAPTLGILTVASASPTAGLELAFNQQEFALPVSFLNIRKPWVDSVNGEKSGLSVAIGFIYSSAAEIDQPYLSVLHCLGISLNFTYLGNIPIGRPEYLAAQVLVMSLGLSQFSVAVIYSNSLLQELVSFEAKTKGITLINQYWAATLETDSDLPGPGFECIGTPHSQLQISCVFRQSPSKLAAISFKFNCDPSQTLQSQELYRLTVLPELQIERIFPGNSAVAVAGRYNTSSQVLLFFLPSVSVFSLYSWPDALSLSQDVFDGLSVLEYSPGQVGIWAGSQYPQGVWLQGQKAQIVLGNKYSPESILQTGTSLVYYSVDGKPLNSIGIGALFYLQTPKKSKMVWYIIIGVIGLAAIIIGVAYFRGRIKYSGASGMYQSDVLISQVEGEVGHLDSDLRRSGGELLRDVANPEAKGGRKGTKSFGEA